MLKKKCSVDGCEKHSKTRGLCQTHYMRLVRSGTTDDPVVEDKTKHPLYITWVAAKRVGRLSDEWLDFWRFVKDVSPIPEGNCRIYRVDTTKPYSKENCHWKTVSPGKKPDETGYEYQKRKQREKKSAPLSSRARALRRIYGMSHEEYDAMSESQGHVCAICGNPETAQSGHSATPKKLSVDHCHATRKVRGLLCHLCNTAIGKFNDNPDLLMRAIEYLKKHQTV